MRSTALALVKRTAKRCDQYVLRSVSVVEGNRSSLPAKAPSFQCQLRHYSETRRGVERVTLDEAAVRPQNEQDAHLLFLDFLKGAPARPPMPSSVKKLDAYLHLRQFEPNSLASLDDEALNLLCMQIGLERIGGVINNVLDDLEGTASQEDAFHEETDLIMEMSKKLQEGSGSPQKGGIFAALPGSRRRMTAVQNLIIGASRRRTTSVEDNLVPSEEIDEISSIEHIMSDSTLSRSLNLLLFDYRLLQQEQGYDINVTSPIPIDLDVGTARRLCRSIYRSKDSSLAPILGELIKHLSRSDMIEGAFPMALEGCHLLNFYLRIDKDTPTGDVSVHPSTNVLPASSSSLALPEALQAANHILDQMYKSDPETITDLVISEASKEGHAFKSYLRDQGVSEGEASLSSLRITLHHIVFLVMLKRRRFTWVEKQLTRILDDITSLTKQHDVEAPLWLLVKPVRLSIRQAVTAPHGRKKSFDLATQFLDLWTQAERIEGQTNGGILRMICERAVSDNDPRLVIRMLQIMTDRRSGEPDRLAPEATSAGAPILLKMFNFQANQKKGFMVAQMLATLGLVNLEGRIVDDRLDILFPGPLRAEFVAIVAKAGLKRQSRALYERWGCELTDGVSLDEVFQHIRQVRDQEISRRKPRFQETVAAISGDVEATVAQSHKCLTSLVKLFTRDHDKPFLPSFERIEGDELIEEVAKKDSVDIQEDIQFAYHVVFQFVKGRDRSLMDRGDFIALSSAYFCLGQRMAAFKCLGDIVKREDRPTLAEASVLLRLLTTVDIVKTAELLLARISYWVDKGRDDEWAYGSEGLAQLYVPLLGTCLRQGRIDIASRLLTSTRSIGIHEDVGVKAIAGLLKYTFLSVPSETLAKVEDGTLTENVNTRRDDRGSKTLFIAKWVKNLMEREKWRPEPSLLSWMCQKAVREPGLIGASTRHTLKSPAFVPFSLKDNNRKAAILLMSLSAKYLGYVDLQVARVILATIQNKAFQYAGPSSPNGRLVDAGLSNEIDEVANNLRWTPHVHYNDGFMLEDQAISMPAYSNGRAAAEPNRLPPVLYCRLITTYLRVGDIHGAASVMAWAREEAGISFSQIEAAWDNRKYSFKDFLTNVAFNQRRSKYGTDPVNVLELLAGAEPIPKSKLWWQRGDM
ncbi:hypothetical protein CBS101457_006596 [Exobasidium rhododendri]|nr:hypothetical protein CBS101457_006596 [Exobasidium rhododendri]